MRLGLNLGYAGGTFDAGSVATMVSLAQLADRVGFHSVWTAEAYGNDAVVPLTWLAAHTERIDVGSAILQMPARTPANTAMTAATLDAISGGRFRLGLGLSGPQVVEGWHGVPYGKPLTRSREYVEIVRTILRREERLEYDGDEYQIPYRGDDATGLGKPLKMIMHPHRADIPIYLAAIGPKNVALTAEIADGWLPIFFSPQRFQETYGEAFAGVDLNTFDIAPTAPVVMGDDVSGCRDLIKPMLALYVGGMGAKGKNFYNDLACRYGFEAAAKEIQDLYLDGKKQEAAAAVPDELVDEIGLFGPKERIAERIELWRDSPITTLIVGAMQPDAIEHLAELVT